MFSILITTTRSDHLKKKLYMQNIIKIKNQFFNSRSWCLKILLFFSFDFFFFDYVSVDIEAFCLPFDIFGCRYWCVFVGKTSYELVSIGGIALHVLL